MERSAGEQTGVGGTLSLSSPHLCRLAVSLQGLPGPQGAIGPPGEKVSGPEPQGRGDTRLHPRPLV